jgi:hypothetical protein
VAKQQKKDSTRKTADATTQMAADFGDSLSATEWTQVEKPYSFCWSFLGPFANFSLRHHGYKTYGAGIPLDHQLV